MAGLLGLHDYLEGLFGCAVDMVQRERLKPFLRDRIIAEAEGRFVTPTPPRQPLEDMLDAINWIREITSGKSLVDYRADRLIRDAGERNVERLSEASRRLPDAWKADYPNLPWKDIAAIGSILRHAYDRIEYDRIEYDRIEDDRIWSVVIDDLPPLRAAVLAMIAACKRTGSP